MRNFLNTFGSYDETKSNVFWLRRHFFEFALYYLNRSNILFASYRVQGNSSQKKMYQRYFFLISKCIKDICDTMLIYVMT